MSRVLLVFQRKRSIAIVMDSQAQRKLLQYETFVNDVLKEDLAKLAEKLDATNADLADCLQLKVTITTFQNRGEETFKDGFKTMFDIGNSFFMQACVTDASKILLDVGLGYYVEFTLDEALVVINVRIKLLEQQVARLRRMIARINARIKLGLLAMQEIQGIGKSV